MTSATNALDENRRPEELQRNNYSPVVDPASNQALIKEVRNSFEALTAVLLQIQIFLNVMLCHWVTVS
jgi:hypothetical protein